MMIRITGWMLLSLAVGFSQAAASNGRAILSEIGDNHAVRAAIKDEFNSDAEATFGSEASAVAEPGASTSLTAQDRATLRAALTEIKHGVDHGAISVSEVQNAFHLETAEQATRAISKFTGEASERVDADALRQIGLRLTGQFFDQSGKGPHSVGEPESARTVAAAAPEQPSGFKSDLKPFDDKRREWPEPTIASTARRISTPKQLTYFEFLMRERTQNPGSAHHALQDRLIPRPSTRKLLGR